jgi:outer membrane lipoprotein SlyB
MRGTKRLMLAAAVAALALAGCSATVDTDGLEGQIAQELEAQAGVRPTSVQCPDDVPAEAGATFECTATADDGSTATITVTQEDDQGNLSWEVTSTG